MDPAGLTVAAEGGRRFRALMDGHHRPGAPPKIGRTIRHATAGRRRAPAPGHHLHPRHHDRRRPGAWLARGSGIAVGGRTIGPAIDEGGRQTHVPGVSSRAASAPPAQGKPCRSPAGTGRGERTGPAAAPHPRQQGQPDRGQVPAAQRSWPGRPAIGPVPGRGRKAAPALHVPNRTGRLLTERLRLGRNTRPRARSAAWSCKVSG